MSNDQPLLRVLRGTPTAEELAALVGAVLTRSRPDSGRLSLDGSAWVDSARPGAVTGAGLPVKIGRGGWRASALPR